jgi:hypothetical protein
MQEGIDVGKSCHAAIHDLIPDEKKLGRFYKTKEKLLAHPEVAKFVKWKQERAQRNRRWTRAQRGIPPGDPRQQSGGWEIGGGRETALQFVAEAVD